MAARRLDSSEVRRTGGGSDGERRASSSFFLLSRKVKGSNGGFRVAEIIISLCFLFVCFL